MTPEEYQKAIDCIFMNAIKNTNRNPVVVEQIINRYFDKKEMSKIKTNFEVSKQKNYSYI